MEMPRVQVLELDEDLLGGLDQKDAATATRWCTAPVVGMARGRWQPRAPSGALSLGLLVLDGLILRRVVVGERHSVEPLGPGDLLRPWAPDSESVPVTVYWRVEVDAVIADLDERFLRCVSRWPEVFDRLVDRAFQRQRSLALRLAIAQEGRLADSLHLLFWHLADRWGRVGPRGTVVALPLSRQVLADLACVQRRSVSRALAELSERGLVSREAEDRWMLFGDPPALQSREASR